MIKKQLKKKEVKKKNEKEVLKNNGMSKIKIKKIL